MRALIAGVVVGAIASACTTGTSYGTARYSAEARPNSAAPVVSRRNVPVWPADAAPRTSAPPAYATRTMSSQPIVMSSRADARPAPAPTVSPLPAPRSRSAAEIAARLRPINATCPVMLGTPVDPSVTASFRGRVVAFADLGSRSKWLADPDHYAMNLPGAAAFGSAGGFGSASDGPVFAAASASGVPSSPRFASQLSPSTARVSAPLASPELPAFAMPPVPTPVPVAASMRSSYPPAAVIAPAVPAAPVAAAAAPAPTPVDADAGGTCTDGECPGGNCKLPPRRK